MNVARALGTYHQKIINQNPIYGSDICIKGDKINGSTSSLQFTARMEQNLTISTANNYDR